MNFQKMFQRLNLDERKALYKQLAAQHHPDLGGNTEVMQALNAAYESCSQVRYNIVGSDMATLSFVRQVCNNDFNELTEKELAEKIANFDELYCMVEKYFDIVGEDGSPIKAEVLNVSELADRLAEFILAKMY